MKKLFSILLAGFIGFLGIFTTTSTFKNTAEPQYFLQNERKNAFVIDNSNSITFYLDNSLEFFNEESDNEALAYINAESECIITFYLTNGSNYIFNLTQFIEEVLNPGTYELGLYSNSSSNYFSFYNSQEGSLNIADRDSNSIWYTHLGLSADDPVYYIDGFTITGFSSISLSSSDTFINNIIGDLTSLPTNNQNSSIEQIGSIISDTTNWFVNIFLGLSNIFYSNGTLGVWGSVLFLGVAFTLITMCLKWVISLVRRI